MKFLLFSKISFETPDPIALIECYCYQSDFYANYDILLKHRDRVVEDVNKIGARIKNEVLRECKEVTDKTKDVRIFKCDLDEFLELDDETRNNHVRELNEKVIKKLLKINKGRGIGLSQATKVLHTLYPNIIPMIDDTLQKKYREEINKQWTPEQSDQIFTDFYKNLKEECNRQNLTRIFEHISKNNLKGLTKVRIFDILWWSYLKAVSLKSTENINWSTIK